MLAHLNIYGEYDRLLGCLQVRYTDAMAMVMAIAMVMAMAMAMPMPMIMSNKRKPLLMPPSQDEAHTIIEDLIKNTVSNSDNDLHLVQATSQRWNGRMLDIAEVEIWRTVSLWMFLLSLLSLLFTFLLWISAQYKWRQHGFLPPSEISQVEVEFPCAPDPPKVHHMILISCGTYGFVHLCTLNGCFIVVISTLVWVYTVQVVCT